MLREVAGTTERDAGEHVVRRVQHLLGGNQILPVVVVEAGSDFLDLVGADDARPARLIVHGASRAP